MSCSTDKEAVRAENKLLLLHLSARTDVAAAATTAATAAKANGARSGWKEEESLPMSLVAVKDSQLKSRV